jgi:hypothetical protein
VQEPTYNQDGSYAVTEIRSQDNKDRWLVKLNLERGSFEELDYQHDEALIGGPGIPSYADASDTGFLETMKQFTFNQKQRDILIYIPTV